MLLKMVKRLNNIYCTLRVYEASPKVVSTLAISTNSSVLLSSLMNNKKLCREVICYQIDPYRKSKTKVCCLMYMALDDHFITAICQVEPKYSERAIIITRSREDFLHGETDGDGGAEEYNAN